MYAQDLPRVHRGVSPKQIAQSLNREGIAGSFGVRVESERHQGNGKRGTGFLNNELYIGPSGVESAALREECRYQQTHVAARSIRPVDAEGSPAPCASFSDGGCGSSQNSAKNYTPTARYQDHRRIPASARRPAQSALLGLNEVRLVLSAPDYIMTGKHRLGCYGARDRSGPTTI